jgi:hypothetical protein
MPESAADYLKWLRETLEPAYTQRSVIPGHDVSHVDRMVNMAPRVTNFADLDQDELAVAIWLHNLDRAPDLGIGLDKLYSASLGYLASSPFEDEARHRIALAAGEHHKKEECPGDSSVLRALRALDRIDRMNALGVLTAATTHAIDKPLYILRNPLSYELQPDGQPYCVYDDLAGRIMEFPLMIPPDLRYLIDVQGMRDFVSYVRTLAAHISRAHGLENGIEPDLHKALGPLYELYAGDGYPDG